MLVPAPGIDFKTKGPKLRRPEHLSVIIHRYAQALFYVEASKYPKPHPDIPVWFHKLAQRIRERVILRLEEVEKSEKFMTLGFHGLRRPQVEHILDEALQESIAQWPFPAVSGIDSAEPSSMTPGTDTDAVGAKRRSFVEPLLTEKGWSPLQWSVEAEVAYHTAVDYLNGITKPNRKSRVRLARSLGVSPNELPE